MFNFLCPLHVSNPRVHLQEEFCIYSYGRVRFTCIGTSSLAGIKFVFDITDLLYGFSVILKPSTRLY